MNKLIGILKVFGITVLIMAGYFVGAIFSILLSPVIIGLIAYAVYKLNNDQEKEKVWVIKKYTEMIQIAELLIWN